MSIRQTQRDLVLELLHDGRWHSTIEFVELGVLRGPARVHELRRRGFVIEVRRVDRRGRSAVYAYRLASNQADVTPPCELTARADVDEAHEPPPAEPVEDVQLPSLEERRRIVAEARAAFAIATRRFEP